MNQDSIQYSIEGQPDFSLLNLTLKDGETVKVEAAAMATMDTNVQMKTKMRGGLGRLITGESLFINEFTAKGGAGKLGIAPSAPGDIEHISLNGETIFVQNSGFLAASLGIQLETKWQGFTKGFFSGESFFLIRCFGTGDLFFNTFGAMIQLPEVDSNLVVDTGHIVAFTGGLEYEIGRVGGYKSLFFSGEGLICRFKGRGKVWLQSRRADRFVSWASYFRPVKSRS